MKRAKVLINKTVAGNMKYNIFVFKNEPAKKNLDYYLGIDPIAVVTEDENNVEEGVVFDVEPTADDKGEGYDYITYSLPYEFVYRNNFFMFNLIDIDGKTDRKLEIYVGKVSIREILVKQLVGGTYINEMVITNRDDIAKVVTIESNNAVALSKEIVNRYNKITMNLNTKKIPYIDSSSDGVYKPQFSIVEKLKEYELHPKVDSQSNIFNYAVVGIDHENKITDVSNLSSILLAENPNDIEMIVEYSDDYFSKKGEASWNYLDKVHAANAYRIKKSDMYSRVLPEYNVHEIKADDSNVEVYGERLLILPNLWHRDKIFMLYRSNRAYRLKNIYEGQESDYSEVFYNEGSNKVSIDKMIIYKKRVTYLDEEDRNKPIEIGDTEAEILKIYVRAGGRYYADALENPRNRPIEIVSENSRLPIFQIKDHTLYSNHYNYTVYLYDEKGKQSEPYSKVM